MQELRLLLAAVPGLFYLAIIFALLGLWAEDVRGIYIAGFCALCGGVQLGRNPSR